MTEERQQELLQRWWAEAHDADDWVRVAHICHGAFMVAIYSAPSTAHDWEEAADLAYGRADLEMGQQR